MPRHPRRLPESADERLQATVNAIHATITAEGNVNVDMLGEARDMFIKLVKTHIDENLGEELTKWCDNLSQSLEADVLTPIMTGAKEGEDQAGEKCSDWAGLHHSSYRATTRRGGLWEQRDRDWGGDLHNPMKEEYQGGWVSWFNMLPQAVDNLEVQGRQVLEDFIEDLSEELPEELDGQVSAYSSTLVDSAIAALRSECDKIQEKILSKKDDSADFIEQELQARVKEVATEASAIRGTGCTKKQKDAMREGVTGIRFEETAASTIKAMQKCQDYLKNLKKEAVRATRVLVEEHYVSLWDDSLDEYQRAKKLKQVREEVR